MTYTQEALPPRKIPMQEIVVAPKLTVTALDLEKHSTPRKTCPTCKQSTNRDGITLGDRTWHVQCFMCSLCNTEIDDAGFYNYKGYPLHPACYLTLFGPFCPVCSEPLGTEDVIEVDGFGYHKGCLRCSKCGQGIRENEKIHMKRNIPICEACYSESNHVCIGCKTKCGGTAHKKYLWCGSVHYLHDSCAVCVQCKKKITHDNFAEANNIPLCRECWYKCGKSICKRCSEPVLVLDEINYFGKWHRSCFRCCRCDSVFDGETPHVQNGELFCERCFRGLSVRCSICGDVAERSTVQFEGRVYHTKCWRCSNCREHLSQNDASMVNGLPMCGRCLTKKQHSR